jgi:vacuolar-type H+-ATPase subunit I/STV1
MAEEIKEAKDNTQEEVKETRVTTIKVNGEEVPVDERVFKHFQSKTKAEIEQKLQPILQKVEALEREKEESIKASMTEAQLRKYTEQKEVDELKKAKEELESYRQQARKEKIENSLHNELGKYNDIYNRKQVISQLKSEYDLDLLSTDGFSQVVAKKGDQVIPIADAIDLLRKDESHANLWIASVKSGNQTKKTGKSSGDTSLDTILSLPASDFTKAFEKGEFNNLIKK